MTERTGFRLGRTFGLGARLLGGRRLAGWAVGVLAALLLSVNLLTYPAPWFDEGLNLATARTLSETGLYALPDASGPRLFDPAIQSGPLIIVPAALVFWVFGPDLLAARAVMAAMGGLALLGYALLARSLLGRGGALLALLLLLAGNANLYTSFVPLARHALGEVPALGLLAVCLWRWQRLVLARRQNFGALALVGLGFGLAMNTKSQVLVVFAVTWACYCLLDRFYYWRASWRAFLVPGCAAGAVIMVWYLVQWWTLPSELLAANAAVLREGFATHIVTLNLRNVLQALHALWSIQFLVWGAPGLVYALLLARRQTRAGFVWAGPALLTLIWMVWFTLLSIGWARYAFVGAAFALFGTAALLRDMLRAGWRGARPQLGFGLTLALTATVLVLNGRHAVRGVLWPQPDSYGPFIQALDARVPPGAVVETSEWELSIGSDRRLHHPPTVVVNQVTRVLQSGSRESVRYTRPAPDAQFVIDGPFSGWTGLYKAEIERRGTLIEHIGPYALYALRPEAR